MLANSRSWYLVRLAPVILGLVGLIGLHWLGWLAWPENFFLKSFSFLLTRDTALSIKARAEYRFFSNRAEFINAAEQCFDDNLSAVSDAIELKKLVLENAELKAVLSFKNKQSTPPILANVISRDLNINQQIVIIDKGAAEGVSLGAPVIIKQGIYIGAVIKVNPTSAVVRLLNDNQSKVAVTILNQDASIGVLEGGFGISLKIRFIPRNENIRIGDQIITSGLEKTIPRGLSLGTVTVVENEAYQPFQEAAVSPLADLSKISTVAVLVGSN